MADYVASVCQSAHYQLHLQHVRPLHLQLPRLLQFCTLWHHWKLISNTAASTECRGQVDHADRSARTHYTHSDRITLAACSTSGRLQIEHVAVQVTAWDSSAILVGWMPAGAWRQLPTTQSSSKITRAMPLSKIFAVAGPRPWNMLPVPLCLVNDFACFKRLLKAHLFNWGCDACWLFAFRHCKNVLTQSLTQS